MCHSVTADITAIVFELRSGVSHLLREGLMISFFARWIFVVLNAEGCDIICKEKSIWSVSLSSFQCFFAGAFCGLSALSKGLKIIIFFKNYNIFFLLLLYRLMEVLGDFSFILHAILGDCSFI